MVYKRGDYFGELALLNEEPRQATCTAKSRCKIVSMDKHAFKVIGQRLVRSFPGLLPWFFAYLPSCLCLACILTHSTRPMQRMMGKAEHYLMRNAEKYAALKGKGVLP